jgi:hypothetical protein
MVLFHKQRNSTPQEAFKKTADYLKLKLSDEDIDYGIKNIFYNNELGWSYYKQNGSDRERKLFALRSFVSNGVSIIEREGGYKFESEVDAAERYIPMGLNWLRKEGLLPKWWQFWKN